MNHEVLSATFETIALSVSAISVVGILAILALGRKIIALPKDMIVVKAAVFRLLRSNQIQSDALVATMHCQVSGDCNGEIGESIEKVKKDQKKITNFLTGVAMGKVSPEDGE